MINKVVATLFAVVASATLAHTANTFIISVPLVCITHEANEYHVSEKLIISVLNVKRGSVGLVKRNKNGTYDLGPAQINTSWWPTLYRYGITSKQVQYNR